MHVPRRVRLWFPIVTTSLMAFLADGPARARELTVQEAVAQAQHAAAGTALSVQTLHVGKRKVYRVKVLTRDGQVRVIQVQAEQ